MELPPFFLQTVGSLVAIVALAGLAWWLKLGGSPRLASDADVHRAASEVEDGFIPVNISCAQDGMAALAKDADGRIMLIKRHGNHFAGRLLGPQTQARLRLDHGMTALEVDCGEARFGKVSLDMPSAKTWAEAINRLSLSDNA